MQNQPTQSYWESDLTPEDLAVRQAFIDAENEQFAYFVPDQSEQQLDELLTRTLSMISAMNAAGAMKPAEIASMMTAATDLYKKKKPEGLTLIIDHLAARVADVSNYTKPYMMDLIQYIVINGDAFQPYSIATFKAIGQNISQSDAKQTAMDVKQSSEFNKLTVNPLAWKGSETIGDTKAAIASGKSLYWLNKPILFPASEAMTLGIEVELPEGTQTVEYPDLPYPDFEGKLTYRTYYPVYKGTGGDNRVFNVLSYAAAKLMPGPNGRMLLEARNELARCVNLNFYGGGSPQGQIERFNAVSERGKLIKTQFAMGDHSKYIASMLPRIFRFEVTAKDYEFLAGGLKLSVTDMIDAGNDAGFPLLSLNKTANAGPWYKKMVREETFLMDLMIAQLILDDCAVMGAKDKGWDWFWSKWSWLSVVYMKNKSEVYARTQFKTKTRNIYVFDGFVPTLAGVMLRLPMRSLKPIVVDKATRLNKPDQTCLLGFSFSKGNFHNFISGLKSRQSAFTRVYSFSDNMYLYNGSKGWASFDGEKMEGCVTQSDMRETNRFIMNEFWKSVAKNSGQTSAAAHFAWHTFLVEVFPHISVDGVAIFGSNQLQIVGQASGNQATGLVNQAKMGCVAVDLEDILLDKIPAKGVLKHSKPEARMRGMLAMYLGTTNTVQLTNDLTKFSLKRGVSLTLEQTCTVDDFFSKDKVVKIDFLGADMIYTELFGQMLHIPVLNRDRLVKAMAFDKQFMKEPEIAGRVKENASGNDHANKTLEKTAYLLMKFRQLYLIGGWAYPELSAALKAVINDAFAVLLSASSDPINAVITLNIFKPKFEEEELWDIADEGGTEVENIYKIQGVPTMWNVFACFSSVESRKLGRDWLEETWDVLTDDELMEIAPWSMLFKMGAKDRLDQISTAKRAKQLTIQFLGATVETIPVVEARVKPSDVKPGTAKKTEKHEVRGARPNDPLKGAFPAQNKKGAWKDASTNASVLTKLRYLNELGPLIFLVKGSPTSLSPSLLETKFCTWLLTNVNSAGKVSTFDETRKTWEEFKSNKFERCKLFTCWDGDKAYLEEFKERIEFKPNPKHGFNESLTRARAVNPGANLVIKL